MRQGGADHTSLVMYRRSPAGLNPTLSFIVHSLSSNEPFGTRTVGTLLVLPLRQYCAVSDIVYSNFYKPALGGFLQRDAILAWYLLCPGVSACV